MHIICTNICYNLFRIHAHLLERGGAATAQEGNGDTTLDPLYIDIAKRDEFPKNNLLGGFIVSLCLSLSH